MTYLYECDGFCSEPPFEGRSALIAEFNEDWYDETASGDQLRQADYEPGDLVTLCPECTRTLLIDY
jgi:hypothetical protein